MKILLIQAHLGRSEPHPPLYPLGLAYLATALTKHDVRIIDLNAWELDESYETLKKKITSFKPDIAGISIRNIDTTNRRDIFNYFKTVRPTAKIVKETSPDITLLAGGSGFSMFAENIMSKIQEFDIGCHLEAEESLPELLDNIKSPESVKGLYIRKNGEIVFTGDRELPSFKNLPMPRRDEEIIDNTPYIRDNKFPKAFHVGIQTKRGCVMKCDYCSYPFLSGNRLRIRSPKDVVDEIEYLISLGISRFSFVDNIFNVPKSHAEEICNEILRRKLDVQWSAWFEIKNTTKELMDLVHKAGCRKAGFSPDAATDKALATLQKDISEALIRDNVEFVRTFPDIEVGYGIFLDLPGVDIKGYLKTLVVFVRMALKFYGQGGVSLGWIRIEPHTGIYTKAVAEGLIDADVDLLPGDDKDLEKLFYMRPSMKFLNSSVLFILNFVDSAIKPCVKTISKMFLKKGKKDKSI